MSAERPTVWIGKHGVSNETLVEIGRQLERKEVVKARILKPTIEGHAPRMIANEVAQRTQSATVEVRGHTFILYRKKKKCQNDKGLVG